MNTHELTGYLASLLVLATFCMRDMMALRGVAMMSNLAFITYALLEGIGPVLLLHMALLPLNAIRLRQTLVQRRQTMSAHTSVPTTRRVRAPAPRGWPRRCAAVQPHLHAAAVRRGRCRGAQHKTQHE